MRSLLAPSCRAARSCSATRASLRPNLDQAPGEALGFRLSRPVGDGVLSPGLPCLSRIRSMPSPSRVPTIRPVSRSLSSAFLKKSLNLLFGVASFDGGWPPGVRDPPGVRSIAARSHRADILSLGAGLAPLLSDETPVLKIMSPLTVTSGRSWRRVPDLRFLHPVGAKPGLSRRVDWFVTRESLEGCATCHGASPATPLPPTRSQTPAHRDAPSPLLETPARSRPESIRQWPRYQVRRRPGVRPRSSSSSSS